MEKVGEKVEASERNQSKSIRRALSILDALTTNTRGVSPTEVSRLTGIPKATVSRILSVLVETQYARQDPRSALYSPGWRVLQLSSFVLNSSELRSKARHHLLRLMEQVQETVNLGILHGSQVMYLDRADSVRTVRLYSVVGKCVPAHCTALGKAILAFSPESVVRNLLQAPGLRPVTAKTITDPQVFVEQLQAIRLNGIALDDEEHQEGVRCVAAPVFDYSGSVVGAVSVSAPATRMEGQQLQDVICQVRSTAREISIELGAAL
ncbi:MAG: IclR family transcriptional regulator [Firmicutes bacterium]|jgi:DNA-binding IclR family transcriptional regulator|nr:IclR family transcriptional regulator [Bacillota bacterium]